LLGGREQQSQTVPVSGNALEDKACHSTAAGEEGTEGTPALFKAITE
jgi:hypothetical protein